MRQAMLVFAALVFGLVVVTRVVMAQVTTPTPTQTPTPSPTTTPNLTPTPTQTQQLPLGSPQTGWGGMR
jgi:hypothetical protein